MKVDLITYDEYKEAYKLNDAQLAKRLDTSHQNLRQLQNKDGTYKDGYLLTRSKTPKRYKRY